MLDVVQILVLGICLPGRCATLAGVVFAFVHSVFCGHVGTTMLCLSPDGLSYACVGESIIILHVQGYQRMLSKYTGQGKTCHVIQPASRVNTVAAESAQLSTTILINRADLPGTYFAPGSGAPNTACDQLQP